MKKTLFIFLLLLLCIVSVNASPVIISEEGWYTTTLTSESPIYEVRVNYDENNVSAIVGADILIFNFIPDEVTLIYVTTDTYTYMCDISVDRGFIFNNFTFHVQYSDIYGNFYDNYTSDKKFIMNTGYLTYELGINDKGLYVQRPVIFLIKDYIYTYENDVTIGWFNANVTTVVETGYERFVVSYRIVKIEDYDGSGNSFNSFIQLVDNYLPFGSEVIAIMSVFTTVLKYGIMVLVALVKYPIYGFLLVESIFIAHGVIATKSFEQMIKTILRDNFYLGEILIRFFRGVIVFIVDIIRLLKPLG